MEKPFDTKDLEERLKAKGLTAVEGVAKIAVTEVLAWADESCAIHPNPIVKSIGQGAVAVLQPLALGMVDKIDGVEGN